MKCKISWNLSRKSLEKRRLVYNGIFIVARYGEGWDRWREEFTHMLSVESRSKGAKEKQYCNT